MPMICRPDHWGSPRQETLDVEPCTMYYQDKWQGALHSFGMWIPSGQALEFIVPIWQWLKDQNITSYGSSSQGRKTIIQDDGTWFQWDFKNTNDAILFKLAWVGI